MFIQRTESTKKNVCVCAAATSLLLYALKVAQKAFIQISGLITSVYSHDTI